MTLYKCARRLYYSEVGWEYKVCSEDTMYSELEKKNYI